MTKHDDPAWNVRTNTGRVLIKCSGYQEAKKALTDIMAPREVREGVRARLITIARA